MKAWKEFEALSAKLFKSKRKWANSGEALDFAGVLGDMIAEGQCKLVKQLPLNALTKLVESLQRRDRTATISPVCVKVRRGKGKESEPLVVLSFADFEKLVSMVDFYFRPEIEGARPFPQGRLHLPLRMEGTSSEQPEGR